MPSVNGDAHRVAIIVDPDYGARATDVASRCHTWIVISPTNRAVTAPRRADAFSLEAGFTDFEGAETPEDSLISVLAVVELHHGEYSHDPPVSVLEVIGTPPTRPILDELDGLGFDAVDLTAEGFVARRARASGIERRQGSA